MKPSPFLYEDLPFSYTKRQVLFNKGTSSTTTGPFGPNPPFPLSFNSLLNRLHTRLYEVKYCLADYEPILSRPIFRNFQNHSVDGNRHLPVAIRGTHSWVPLNAVHFLIVAFLCGRIRTVLLPPRPPTGCAVVARQGLSFPVRPRHRR